jgi:hypothetical protein
MSLSDFMPGFVSSFSFADIYESIQQCALTVLSLIESFNPDPVPGAVEAPETVITRRQRYAITCITALLAGSRLTTVQSLIAYDLPASKVPKRVFTTLNSIGISSSYRTLGRIVEQQASEVRKILKAIGARGQAIQIERQDDARVAVVQEDSIWRVTTGCQVTLGQLLKSICKSLACFPLELLTLTNSPRRLW